MHRKTVKCEKCMYNKCVSPWTAAAPVSNSSSSGFSRCLGFPLVKNCKTVRRNSGHDVRCVPLMYSRAERTLIDWLIDWLIRSFTHSFTYTLTHSFTHAFTKSFIHSLTHSRSFNKSWQNESSNNEYGNMGLQGNCWEGNRGQGGK